MHTCILLCALGILVALQVPGSSSKPEKPDQKSNIISSDPKEIVDKHNALRGGVQPSPSNMLKMEWNNEAAANAERWAQTCSRAHSPASKREIKTSGCGENLFMSRSQVSWSKAIQYWYDKIKDWRYGVDSTGKGVLHFTQVVWYNSNKVGCALAYCPNSRFKYLYVCQYCPPGNNQKGPPYKAGPKCGDCPNNCDNGLCIGKGTAVGTANPCPYVDKLRYCPALVQLGMCSGSTYDTWCPASCKCTNKI